MRTVHASCLLLSGLFSFGANAYLVNGTTLLSDYEKRKPSVAGYIEGVSDAGNRTLFCIPPGTGTSQLKKAAMDYLNANTEHLEQSAALLVSQAFKEAFPCSAD